MTSLPADPPIEIVLVQPQIPQNTGNIGRLCVCIGARLHLIRPIGFRLDERSIRRSGLDYWKSLDLQVHDSWNRFAETVDPDRMRFLSTRGEKPYTDMTFPPGSILVFGSEDKGLPPELYKAYSQKLLRIPMVEGTRSLNLAVSVAIIAYHAMHCNNFNGLI